eukprot:15430152-Alexandrium_andersonii.AAC.1
MDDCADRSGDSDRAARPAWDPQEQHRGHWQPPGGPAPTAHGRLKGSTQPAFSHVGHRGNLRSVRNARNHKGVPLRCAASGPALRSSNGGSPRLDLVAQPAPDTSLGRTDGAWRPSASAQQSVAGRRGCLLYTSPSPRD